MDIHYMYLATNTQSLKQKLAEVEEEIDTSALAVGDYNSPLSH